MPSGHMARQNGDTHQESYVPTKIKAAQLAQLKAKRDTNIIGSTVSGKKVEVDTGHNLHIQSLQDVDNFKEHSKSAGFSVSSKPNFKDPTGSINASVGRIDSKWKSVTEQAGIYAGEEGYNINVGNKTTLEGAVIKSDAPKAKNKLTTKSLEMKTNDKKGYDKIYNSTGLVPNLGVGSKGKASSTTQSAISDGILTVDGKEIDTKTINTNTENTLHQLDKIFDKKEIEERQELARLFAKNAFEEVHRLSDKYHWKEGSPEKVALHAAIGEITAQLAGNPNGSGAVAAGINQLAIKKIIDKVGREHPDQVQMLSTVLGGTLNSIIGKSYNVGATMASYGSKWNDLGEAHEGRRPVDVIVAVDSSGITGHVSIIIKYEKGGAEEGNYGRYEGDKLVDSSGVSIAAPNGFGTIYIDQKYEFKKSSDIKYYYLNLNAEAVQSAFNRNFKNAEYVLEKKGENYQLYRIPGHSDDYQLMSHNCVTVSVDALVDGSGSHPTLDRLRGAILPAAVGNLLDQDYENNQGLVYKVE